MQAPQPGGGNACDCNSGIPAASVALANANWTGSRRLLQLHVSRKYSRMRNIQSRAPCAGWKPQRGRHFGLPHLSGLAGRAEWSLLLFSHSVSPGLQGEAL